ncbi:hypothetical protein V8Z80_04870 [Orrella sp. JC864]|uniref:hypothetical protein n=1 Tax=Orrella sp. JC864 TaxID=3120298 RepID=UPI00300A68D0
MMLQLYDAQMAEIRKVVASSFGEVGLERFDQVSKIGREKTLILLRAKMATWMAEFEQELVAMIEAEMSGTAKH